MNIKQLLCAVSALALAAAGAAQTQSLTDLAKQEKQRRARLRASGSPTRVYTENNRSTAPMPEVTDPAAAPLMDPLALAAPGGKKEKTREELAADMQKLWADKVKAAQDEITALEGAISKNERNLASLINITPARQDLANAIEGDKKRVGELKQSLVNLEEERRRAGMPRR